MSPFIHFLVFIMPPLLFSAVLHEVSHGFVAEKLGDPTARSQGRITLNPLKHIDLYMTVFLPAVLALLKAPVFAGAKPVPVNPMYFRNPRRGMAYVAMAGPLVNFALALLCYAGFQALNLLVPVAQLPLFGFVLALFAGWLLWGILINLILGLFNLLPVPPLDGGRIAVGFLPLALAKPLARLEPFGLLIVIFLLFSGIVEKLLDPAISFVTQHLVM